MTSRQWAEISIAFDTPPGERTEWQRTLTLYGLCFAHWKMCPDEKGLDRALVRFCGRRAFEWGFLADYNPETRAGSVLRASLAALFAAMSQRERDAVLGKGF